MIIGNCQDINEAVITEDVIKVTVGEGNSIPVANAGTDQNSNVNQAVQLNSSAHDADGDALSFEWYFTSKPGSSNAAVANANSKAASFTPDAVGTYVVTIKVSDGKANTANAVVSNFDSMVVTVSDVNTPPVVQLGPDLTGDLRVYRNSAVQLYGDKSYDVDAQPLTYTWTLSVKPDNSNVSISEEQSSKKNSHFTPDVTGMYTVQLSVSDGSDSNAGTLNIEVDDLPPVVNILSHTDGESITPEGPVTLKGSVNDPEDGKLADASIQWNSNLDGTLGHGENITIVLSQGEHIITLMATDIYSHTTQATINLTVLKSPDPVEVPTVTITAPVNNQAFPSHGNIIFEGSATDAQGTAITGDKLAWILGGDSIGTSEKIDVKLVDGIHTVTLRATDGNALQGFANITVQVKANSAPQVTISKPAAENLFLQDEEITFEGSAIDAEDGEITDPTKFKWTLENGEMLCDGIMSCKKVLPQGEHVVVLTVTDNDGVEGKTTVTVKVKTEVINPVNCAEGKPCIKLLNTKTRGQVAYYPFNGNADDASGNGNHGVVNGAVLTEDRDGNAEIAYSFDGVDDYINIGQLDNMSIEAITVSAWIKKRVKGKNFGFVGKWNTGSKADNSFLLYNGEQDHVDIPAFVLRMNDGSSAGVSSSDKLTVDTFENLIATWSSEGKCRMYLNGKIVGENNDCGAGKSIHKDTFNYNTVIGNWGVLRAAPYYFEGEIDEVSIYDRVLSGNELKAIDLKVDYAGTTEDTFVINALVTDETGIPISDESISWEINADGSQLGTGDKLSTKLPAGNHIIRITATSGSGAIVVKTLTVYVDESPTVEIKSPVNEGAHDAGDVIAFTAVAADNEEGDISDKIVWTSNIDGELGTGKQVLKELSIGIHTISVTVQDSFGNEVSVSLESRVLALESGTPETRINLVNNGDFDDSIVGWDYTGDNFGGNWEASASWSVTDDGIHKNAVDLNTMPGGNYSAFLSQEIAINDIYDNFNISYFWKVPQKDIPWGLNQVAINFYDSSRTHIGAAIAYVTSNAVHTTEYIQGSRPQDSFYEVRKFQETFDWEQVSVSTRSLMPGLDESIVKYITILIGIQNDAGSGGETLVDSILLEGTN